MISEEHEIASIYSPSQPIEVTFCGEPAIGDGGPKREYCGMIVLIVFAPNGAAFISSNAKDACPSSHQGQGGGLLKSTLICSSYKLIWFKVHNLN